MEMENFYKVLNGDSNNTFQAELIDSQFVSDKPINYPEKSLKWGEYEGIHFPVVFGHIYGRVMKDILGTGSISFYLISDRMKQILEECNLTGWKTFQIKLFGKKGEEITGYHGFSVTGRGGFVDYTSGKLCEKEENQELGFKKRKFYKGISIDLSNWDGSSFFKPDNSNGIIITEEAANAIKAAHLTNIVLINLNDVEIDERICS